MVITAMNIKNPINWYTKGMLPKYAKRNEAGINPINAEIIYAFHEILEKRPRA